MDAVITLTIDGEQKQYPKGISFREIAAEYQKAYTDTIVLVSFNNRLRELVKCAEKDGELSFITTADEAGKKTYRRSMTLLMQKAVYHLLGREKSAVRVMHCISQAYYCELINYGKPDEKLLEQIRDEMLRMVKERIPILKKNIETDEAVELFRELGMTDKERLFRYRRSSRVNLYSLDHYVDYFYGYMVPDTGYLDCFSLQCYGDGFVLMFPGKDTKQVAEFSPSVKHFETLGRSRHRYDWCLKRCRGIRQDAGDHHGAGSTDGKEAGRTGTADCK